MGIQSVDLWVMAPTIALAIGALLALLVDLFVPSQRKNPRSIGPMPIAGVAALVAVVAAGALLPQSIDDVTLCSGQSCAYAVGALTVAIQIVVLVGTATVLLLSMVSVDDTRTPPGEYFFLLMCSASGAMLVPAATDLVTILVAIEVVSLPTFALIAMNRGDRRSGEGAREGVPVLGHVCGGLLLRGGAAVRKPRDPFAGPYRPPDGQHRTDADCHNWSGSAARSDRLQGGSGALSRVGSRCVRVCPRSRGRLPLRRFESGWVCGTDSGRCSVRDVGTGLGAGSGRAGHSHDGVRQRHRPSPEGGGASACLVIGGASRLHPCAVRRDRRRARGRARGAARSHRLPRRLRRIEPRCLRGCQYRRAREVWTD